MIPLDRIPWLYLCPEVAHSYALFWLLFWFWTGFWYLWGWQQYWFVTAVLLHQSQCFVWVEDCFWVGWCILSRVYLCLWLRLISLLTQLLIFTIDFFLLFDFVRISVNLIDLLELIKPLKHFFLPPYSNAIAFHFPNSTHAYIFLIFAITIFISSILLQIIVVI